MEQHPAFVTRDGVRYAAIFDVDRLEPFLMHLVGNGDVWVFAGSNSPFTAGRVDPDTALFPYVTADKLMRHNDTSGATTLFRVRRKARRPRESSGSPGRRTRPPAPAGTSTSGPTPPKSFTRRSTSPLGSGSAGRSRPATSSGSCARPLWRTSPRTRPSPPRWSTSTAGTSSSRRASGSPSGIGSATSPVRTPAPRRPRTCHLPSTRSTPPSRITPRRTSRSDRPARGRWGIAIRGCC